MANIATSVFEVCSRDISIDGYGEFIKEKNMTRQEDINTDAIGVRLRSTWHGLNTSDFEVEE